MSGRSSSACFRGHRPQVVLAHAALPLAHRPAPRSFRGTPQRRTTAELAAQEGDIPIILILGEPLLVSPTGHVGPVILETLLADLAKTALGGLEEGFGGFEGKTLLLFALRLHLPTELFLLAGKVSGGTGLNGAESTFSEGRRKAGVKCLWSWL